MSKILILKGDLPDSESTAVQNLNGLKTHGTDDYYISNYHDIVFKISTGVCEVYDIVREYDLLDFDLVYLRDIGSYEHERNAIAFVLQYNGRKFINDDVVNFQHISKLTQMIALGLGGVEIPKSIYGTKPEYIKRFSQFPFVAKSITGSNGSNNHLLRTDVEFRRVIESQDPVRYIFQQYIPNDYDYRIIVADRKVLMSYKRVRATKEGYLNNVKVGATRLLVSVLDSNIAETAIKAAQLMQRNLAGVDIIVNKETGEHKVLEVNFNFGMDIDGPVADEFYKKLSSYLHTKATSSKN